MKGDDDARRPVLEKLIYIYFFLTERTDVFSKCKFVSICVHECLGILFFQAAAKQVTYPIEILRQYPLTKMGLEGLCTGFKVSHRCSESYTLLSTRALCLGETVNHRSLAVNLLWKRLLSREKSLDLRAV